MCHLQIIGASEAYIHCFWNLSYRLCVIDFEKYILQKSICSGREHCHLQTERYIATTSATQSVTSLHTSNIIHIYYMQSPTCYKFLHSRKWSTVGSRWYTAVLREGLPH
jgi:hypothetical protein